MSLEQATFGNPVAFRPTLAATFANAWPSPPSVGASQRWATVVLAEYTEWMPWLEEATHLLDAAESTRAGRQRFAVHSDAHVLAYALHRLVLGAVLGCPARAVPLQRDPRGRPFLVGGSLHTSLSHADGCAAFAVCNAGCVGVDIEPVSRTAAMPEIAERVAHPAECAGMAGIPEPWRRRELLDLWVRKEALLKAAGIGLVREMASFVAPTGAVRLPTIDGTDDAGLVALSMLDAGPGHAAAVAAPEGLHVACMWLHPR